MLKRKTVKRITAICTCMIVFICSSNVFGKENTNVTDTTTWSLSGQEKTTINHNVSTTAPVNSDIQVYDTVKPAMSKFIDLRKQSMTFSGTAQSSTLYTNNNFIGKARASLVVNNYTKSKLTVKVRKNLGSGTIITITVPANAGQGTTITGLKPDTKYYISFSAPSNFDGSIS